MEKLRKEERQFPHVFMILLLFIAVAVIITHVLPSGEFERVLDEQSGKKLVVAGSYHEVEAKPISPIDIPSMIFEGLTDTTAVTLIFFILLIGASFEIILEAGFLQKFMLIIIGRTKTKPVIAVIFMVCGFSVFGFTMGLSTASVIFLPIGFMAAEILGYDKMAGVALVALGTNVGFAAGVFNPFTVGLAQGYAQLPIFSGAWLRWLLLVTLLLATILYILLYAKRTKRSNAQDIEVEGELTLRQWIELVVYLSAFVYLMIGIQTKGYEVPDIAVFLVSLSIIIGVLHGFHYNELCSLLVGGARKMMTGVFVIGLASTMRLILSRGQVLDSIAYYLLELATEGSNLTVLLAMFYGNALFDLVVTSGTAHGAIAMPIMLPIADYAGISRQATVFAFQLGDGLVNLVSPLSTTLTGILAFSETSYGKWIRFFLPLVGIYMVIGTFFICLAFLTSY